MSYSLSVCACLILYILTADRFVRQLVTYAKGEWPFDLRHDENALKWWESLEKHPQADVLAVSSMLKNRYFQYFQSN